MTGPVSASEGFPMRAFVRWTLVVGLAAAAAGCNPGEPAPAPVTNITGTVTRDGKPLVWPFEGGRLHVIFVPEEQKVGGPQFAAETDTTAGTYRLASIPPGKYLVAVHMFDPKHMDALRNKFDPSHSPLRAEVTTDGQVVNIDIPKELPKDEPKGPPLKGGPKGPPKGEAK